MKHAALRPAFCPPGIHPADWRKALVKRIDQQAAMLSALVDALDAMDGDCDLETDDEAEPWLGWCINGAICNTQDLEIDEVDTREKGFT